MSDIHTLTSEEVEELGTDFQQRINNDSPSKKSMPILPLTLIKIMTLLSVSGIKLATNDDPDGDEWAQTITIINFSVIQKLDDSSTLEAADIVFEFFELLKLRNIKLIQSDDFKPHKKH